LRRYSLAVNTQASQASQGKAVQVDSMKPMLKAPETKRLKLQYDELLASVAFKSTCAAIAGPLV